MSWEKRFCSLKPSMRCHGLADLDFADLASRGIEYLIVDIDNTSATCESKTCEVAVKDSLQRAVKEGHIKGFVFVSNVGLWTPGRYARVKAIAGELGVPFVCAYWPWIKPSSRPFRKALSLMPGATTKNTAVIGDQLFSDIKGGNLLGMLTVLVVPLGPDHWVTARKRKKEKRVFELTGW